MKGVREPLWRRALAHDSVRSLRAAALPGLRTEAPLETRAQYRMLPRP